MLSEGRYILVDAEQLLPSSTVSFKALAAGIILVLGVMVCSWVQASNPADKPQLVQSPVEMPVVQDHARAQAQLPQGVLRGMGLNAWRREQSGRHVDAPSGHARMPSTEFPRARSAWESLPIVISGGGPCGLLCAVTLQKQGVPFVVVEKVDGAKLTADVGSGFDMAETATKIFSRLQFPGWRERMSRYAAIRMMTMAGDEVRVIETSSLPGGEAFGCKRSSLQQMCIAELDRLMNNSEPLSLSQANVANPSDGVPSSTPSGSGVNLHAKNFRYGVSVVGFEETSDAVLVNLSDGTVLRGRCLLSCEGWRSATRAQMLGRDAEDSMSSDPVNYCGIAMWWGRCELSAELNDLLKPTQTNKTGATFCWFMGDGSSPGNFVGAPVDNGSAFLWSAAQHCEVEPEKSADLTVRGGVRGSSVKAELEQILSEQKRCALIRGIVAATPAGNVTKVGLYDRKNLDRKMVSQGGRVVLLGDAAHPQTPFLGQGCNMALADAFAVCTRLGYAYGSSMQEDERDDGVRRALACVEDAERKKFVKKTITDARWIASLSVSDSVIGNFFTRQMFRRAPESFIFPRVDEGNRNFVNKALKDCGLPAL